MLKFLTFIILIFPNFSGAADCKVLNPIPIKPEEIYKQLIENGERSIVIWPREEQGLLDLGVRQMISKWIEKFVRNRNFEHFELKENQSYIFPIQGSGKGESDNNFVSITLRRQKPLNGPTAFILSDLKKSNPDEFLIKLSEFSRGIQNNWIGLKEGIQAHDVLSNYLSVSTTTTKNQIGQLVKNPEALNQIKNMPNNSEQIVNNETRRFVFYKNNSGVVFLLAYTIYKD